MSYCELLYKYPTNFQSHTRSPPCHAMRAISYIFIFILLKISSSFSFYEYCVIGAGPAGLQAGAILESRGLNYIIIEKNPVAGSFFNKYPVMNSLISFNRPGGDRFNWNELLGAPDLPFSQFSKYLYADNTAMAKYLQAYAKHLKLNILYDTRVTRIYNNTIFWQQKNSDEGILNLFTECSRMIFSAIGIVPRASLQGNIPPSRCEDTDYLARQLPQGGAIAVVGQGNSAFESARWLLFSRPDLIVHLYAKKKLQFAYNTHYPGDLRSVNLEIIDSYLLKNGFVIMNWPAELLEQMVVMASPVNDTHLTLGIKFPEYPLSPVSKYDYHAIMDCTGWERHTPFPRSAHSDIVDIGIASTHGLERTSANFIHGLRYRTSLEVRRVLGEDMARFYHKTLASTLARILAERSDLIHLHRHYGYIFDIFKNWRTFQAVPITDELRGHPATAAGNNLLILYMDYGANWGDIFDETRGRCIRDDDGGNCRFIHPILRYNDHELHMHEDETLAFDNTALYLDKIRNFICSYIDICDAEDLPEPLPLL
jgi:hypothetical protein